MSKDDHRPRNWRNAEVVHRQNDRRNSYRGNYENGPQRNQGFQSRNRFDSDNQGSLIILESFSLEIGV
ncbi:hypothetical protein TNCV_1918141 [Trichonephila clavipes]|nr:hypothetical protein TNCV_1918141 [Trichonephila clavipes]